MGELHTIGEKMRGKWTPGESRILRSMGNRVIPREIVKHAKCPLGYVMERYPWGRRALSRYQGPEAWQRKVLEVISEKFAAGIFKIRIAVRSGHGVGKSALVSWIIDWAMDCHVDANVIVTANTANQLKTKTAKEASKWSYMAGIDERFDIASLSISSKLKKHEKTWSCHFIPWKKDNTEGFAGEHNQGGLIVFIIDEASAVIDEIWQVAEGMMSDANTKVIFLAFGNPTRTSGRFYECFHKRRDRWFTIKVDSREVSFSDKEEIAAQIQEYGADSDFCRVRWFGEFPVTSVDQFISHDVVGRARLALTPQVLSDEPLIMGIDVARAGKGLSVVRFRRGMDARSIPPFFTANPDTMYLVGQVCELVAKYKPDQIFIDGGGVGGPVKDRLVQLGHNVIEVNFGGKADRKPDRYHDKRSEMWGFMDEALQNGLAIDDHETLISDLTTPMVEFDNLSRKVLESKKSLAARGEASPDHGDALCLTFAYPVQPKFNGLGGHGGGVAPSVNPHEAFISGPEHSFGNAYYYADNYETCYEEAA